MRNLMEKFQVSGFKIGGIEVDDVTGLFISCLFNKRYS